MSVIHSLLGYLLLGISVIGFLWHTGRALINPSVDTLEIQWTSWLLAGLYGQLFLGVLLFLTGNANHMPSPLHSFLGIGAVVIAHVGLSRKSSAPHAFHLWRVGILAVVGFWLWITFLHLRRNSAWAK